MVIMKRIVCVIISILIAISFYSCAPKRILVIDDPSFTSDSESERASRYETEVGEAHESTGDEIPETMPSIDGVDRGESLVFELDLDNGYYIVVDYNGTADSVEIPATYLGKPVREIGERAFENSIVKSVIIPEGVTHIGESAFFYCTRLEVLTLPDSVTHIANAAFAQCHSLASVDTGEGLKYVGAFAFLHCRNLSDIYLSSVIDYIGDDAFQDTAYYNDEANWKKGVLYMVNDNYVIEGKTDIEGKLFVGTHQTRLIAANAFYGADKITHVDISYGISTICQGAFSNCTSLKSINISMYYAGASGITRIEDGAFARCDALETVFYSGDKRDEQGNIIRNDIDIGENNEALKNATWQEY